jgi:NAD(P)-dependent dehydrogenase (short-subunit alcohol dehydrogenase family)
MGPERPHDADMTARLLEGQVALVTGAGSGIGRAIACHYAAAGAKVLVSDVDESGGRETVTRIEAQGGVASFFKANVATAAENEALVRAAVDRYGGLHVACNNAGIAGPPQLTGDYPIDGWDRVIAVNLSGVFYGMRYQIPALLQAGGGAIVNIASILGQVAFKTAAPYVAAKHGVVGLTKTAAVEYANRNVRVNAVGPGFIMTPLLEKNLSPDALEGIAALHPVGRLGTSDEVAELVLWLSSKKASFVTGSYYPVDGGYLAQ